MADPAALDPALDAVLALQGAAPLLHVLDIGANPIEGVVSYQRLLDRGLCRVTGFEPQPQALAALNARKGPHETYLPDAVGDGGTVRLHVTRSGGFTSVWPRDAGAARLLGWTRGMEALEVVEMPTRRLDDLDLPPVDFLKIDVQGSEPAVLRHGRAALARAVAVQTEVRFLPIYEGEPPFGELDAELRGQGFAFHDLMFLKRVPLRSARSRRLTRRASARQAVDGDAVYLRALTRAEAMDETQLFRLAVLGLGVLDDVGLAVHALDLLAARGRIEAAAVDAVIDLLPAHLRAAP